MAGVSLRGTVEKREKESVYLKLDIDGADGKALHPYPWIPPTGNVMYCMPQEGTEAYLYFPEAEEESAYAVSEIHNSRCPVFADAQRRELVTEHGKKLRLHADMLGFAGGKEETVQECRMGEDGIHFSAGKGKLQVTGSGQITFRAPEISLDAVQKIGQYKMESMAKEKAGRYGAEVMTLTVSGGLGLIPVGGTVVTLPQLAGAFQLVAGIVTSQNLLFQIEEVLMFCTSGKEMGAPTGNWMHDSARELTEMASTQFAFYGLMNPYTYQRPKITLLPNETGLTVPGGTGVAVVPNGTAPALKQPYLPGQYTEYPAAVQGWAQQALPGGGSGIEGGLDTSIKNIDEFIGGNKSFDDVLDDYAKVYADKINSNQAWSWDDTIPGGENLTKKQRSIIKQQAIDAGLITDIKVTKVEGMRYGFADFESAGVVKETQYLPENMWKMSDAEQFKWLDEQIGGTVDGYTWHHTEIPGKMQLVPTGIHNITTHNGGRTAGMWADAPR